LLEQISNEATILNEDSSEIVKPITVINLRLYGIITALEGYLTGTEFETDFKIFIYKFEKEAYYFLRILFLLDKIKTNQIIKSKLVLFHLCFDIIGLNNIIALRVFKILKKISEYFDTIKNNGIIDVTSLFNIYQDLKYIVKILQDELAFNRLLFTERPGGNMYDRCNNFYIDNFVKGINNQIIKIFEELLAVLVVKYVPKKSDNYYEILGISRTANEKEIRKAYLRLLLKWHPDKNPGNKDVATVMFQKIGNAYSTLKDPTNRKRYDLTIEYSQFDEMFNKDSIARFRYGVIAFIISLVTPTPEEELFKEEFVAVHKFISLVDTEYSNKVDCINDGVNDQIIITTEKLDEKIFYVCAKPKNGTISIEDVVFFLGNRTISKKTTEELGINSKAIYDATVKILTNPQYVKYSTFSILWLRNSENYSKGEEEYRDDLSMIGEKEVVIEESSESPIADASAKCPIPDIKKKIGFLAYLWIKQLRILKKEEYLITIDVHYFNKFFYEEVVEVIKIDKVPTYSEYGELLKIIQKHLRFITKISHTPIKQIADKTLFFQPYIHGAVISSERIINSTMNTYTNTLIHYTTSVDNRIYFSRYPNIKKIIVIREVPSGLYAGTDTWWRDNFFINSDTSSKIKIDFETEVKSKILEYIKK